MKTSTIIIVSKSGKDIFNFVATTCKYCASNEVIVLDLSQGEEVWKELELLTFHYSFVFLKLDETKAINDAMVVGAQFASNEVLIFLSSRFEGLRKIHLEQLETPVLNDHASLVFGIPSGQTVDYSLKSANNTLMPFSVLKEDFLAISNDVVEIKFNTQLYVFLYFQLNYKRISFAVLENLLQKNWNKTMCSEMDPFDRNKDTEKELKLAVLDNIDLIVKRLQNNVHSPDNYAPFSISSVQHNLNQRIKALCTEHENSSDNSRFCYDEKM